ncbi:MAG: hypothetical protein IJQ64_02435 [Prevotella sp.]|nr:hypothetical protein [Prevotella sp.]
MKLNKVFFGLTIVAAALFSSCNKDNEGAIYSNQSNAGVSFTASTLSAVEVPASNPVFDVEIVRGNTAGAVTGSLSASLVANKVELSGVTVSNYSFADGENSTTVSVNISPLEVGVAGTLTLTIADADASIGGVKSATIKVSKAYEWKSLGKGYFLDNFFGMESEPEILKAEGFDRYRVIEPCEPYRIANADTDSWVASSSAPFIEFWVEDGLVFWDEWFTGQNYDGDKASPIYAWHPSAFSSLNDPEFWQYSKFLDAKTVQLAPYYYIDGLGGWNYTQKNGVVYIVLP